MKIIDGYGIMPYTMGDIKVCSSTFFTNFSCYHLEFNPQIHINYWNDKNFLDFKKFIEKNYSKVIDANAFSKNSNSILINLSIIH